MIDAWLVFDSGPAALRGAIAAARDLPRDLRPTHHSLGEHEVGQPIDDVEELFDSAWSTTPGPFLRGKSVAYDFSVPGNRPIWCRCDLDVEASRARIFMEHMAAAGPIFGRACVWEELLHRNQIVAKRTDGTAYCWVGRDTAKYVPGLYWLTLLSDRLVKFHGVPLDGVRNGALENVDLGGGQHLFRFYDDPSDWHAGQRAVDTLCASLPGVFNIAAVRPDISTMTNFIESNRALREWS